MGRSFAASQNSKRDDMVWTDTRAEADDFTKVLAETLDG
jgi:hypothetical protein